MRQAVGVALGFLLLGQATLARPAKAGEAPKPAWKWTIEERLAERFAPERRKARLASAQAQLQEMPGLTGLTETQIEQLQVSIDGAETPELLLPSELWVALLIKAYPWDGRRQQENRRAIEARAAALGFGADFWPRLGGVVSNLLELRREADRLGLAEHMNIPADPRLKVPLTPEVLCGAKDDALAAALAEFGEEAFLRFLYKAIAPEVNAPESSPEKLRRLEGGCR
jgi:hypothetical protein